MKAVKILAVVLGGVFLLTGLGLLAGAALVGVGQRTFDQEMSGSNLAGPVQATVREVDDNQYTVSYVDTGGRSQTGTGPTVGGETFAVGDEVTVYYSTDDPSIVVILDSPVGQLGTIGAGLRVGAIVGIALGAVLLIVGTVALLRGRRTPPAGPVPPGPLPYGQLPYGQPPYGQPPSGPDRGPTPR